jgi:hypothetical protein
MGRQTEVPSRRIEPPLGTVQDYDELIPTFDRIIAWAIDAETPIGYFAVIYRQATVAISKAIEIGDEFKDAERMRKFQIVFAQRYFDALDTYNGNAPAFTRRIHVWQQSFDDSALTEPIVFQHLLTALNAHMNLDLGVATATIAREHGVPMKEMRHDFDVVNAVLGYQVESVLDVIDDISPVIRRMRRWTPCNAEVAMFQSLIIVFREMAWTFALKCAAAPDLSEEISQHDTKFDDLGVDYIYAPGRIRNLIEMIAREEKRDVPHNIRALNRLATPSWSGVTEYRLNLNKLADK